MMRKGLTIVLVLLLWSVSANSETVHVSLFNDYSLSAIVVSSAKGKYELWTDDNRQIIFEENDLLYVSMLDDKTLFLRDRSGAIGVFGKITFIAPDPGSQFSIRPVEPSMEMVLYHGSLELSIEFERIRIINLIDENLYLSGVVEAESGTSANINYYMAHSIICRTYLYGNFNRHADEDFDLCDGVHCQVYKGRLTGNDTVCEAVNMTAGKVIVYGDGGLITAAFHSNCGGETVNSEEVWLVPLPYLRSVKDPWCSHRPSATWTRRIGTGDWESYLLKMGLENLKSVNASYVLRNIEKRNPYFSINDFAIPFRKIRNDWNFRSSWFSIEYPGEGHELLVRGKGYGHGVGLCQEGAMEMAVKGYNYMQILQFYYTNINISDTDNLF